MPSREAIGTIFKAFGLTRPEIEPTTCHSAGKHSGFKIGHKFIDHYQPSLCGLFLYLGHKNESSSPEPGTRSSNTQFKIEALLLHHHRDQFVNLVAVERLVYARLWVCSAWLQYWQECSTSLQVFTQNGIKESTRLERTAGEKATHISFFTPEVTTITSEIDRVSLLLS